MEMGDWNCLRWHALFHVDQRHKKVIYSFVNIFIERSSRLPVLCGCRGCVVLCVWSSTRACAGVPGRWGGRARPLRACFITPLVVLVRALQALPSRPPLSPAALLFLREPSLTRASVVTPLQWRGGGLMSDESQGYLAALGNARNLKMIFNYDSWFDSILIQLLRYWFNNTGRWQKYINII